MVAQGGATDCGGRTDGDSVSLLLEMLVDSKDILSADTMIRADHRSTIRKYTFITMPLRSYSYRYRYNIYLTLADPPET